MRWLVAVLVLLVGLPVQAQPDVPPLPGKALFINQPIKVYLTGAQPFDLVFYADAPVTISVYARSLDPSNAVDTTLEVFDLNSETLASNDDLNGEIDAGIENLALPASGVYRIRLGTFETRAAGGVEVQLLAGALPVRQPPTRAETVEGRIEGSQPFEYTFTGQVGQIVTITAEAVNPPSPNLDLAVAIYAPDGTQLDYDDDSGPDAGLGDRDAVLLDVELPAAGEYRIEVSSFMGIKGTFRLTVAPAG